MITQNYGLAGGKLDATKYIERLRQAANGYTDMDRYNHSAPWNNNGKIN